MTEIYLCHPCSDHEIGDGNGPDRLIGEDISCKDATMATRRPLLLSLIRTRYRRPPGGQTS
eukprot:COSAG02_NODE_45783_length_354_cov_0.788235_1_plen_60_part_01